MALAPCLALSHLFPSLPDKALKKSPNSRIHSFHSSTPCCNNHKQQQSIHLLQSSASSVSAIKTWCTRLHDDDLRTRLKKTTMALCSTALLLPTSTLVQCYGPFRPVGTNGECKLFLQSGFRHQRGNVWAANMKPRFCSLMASAVATMDRENFLPDKKVPMYSHSLPGIEAWLQSLGFVQSKDDRAVWVIERPDWHAHLSLDSTELYVRYLKSGPSNLDRDVERKFSYALSREDVENAVLGGP